MTAPEAATIDGVLDGRVADVAALDAAVQQLGAAGAGGFRCEVQGGRFTLWPLATTIAGRFDADAQHRVLVALQAVQQVALPGSLETNLRCRVLTADTVEETLFVVRGDQLVPLTRVRPRTLADARSTAPPRRPAVSRRERWLLAPLLLATVAYVGWQANWLGRWQAAPAAQLAASAGPFADLLQIEVAEAGADYAITLRRGPGYPTTPSELQQQLAAAPVLAARATIDAVGRGEAIYVVLLAADGQALAAAQVSLRPLLAQPDRTVTTGLRKAAAAAGVALTLLPPD